MSNKNTKTNELSEELCMLEEKGDWSWNYWFCKRHSYDSWIYANIHNYEGVSAFLRRKDELANEGYIRAIDSCPALFKLGECYENGDHGVWRNKQCAIYCYCRAALDGYAPAQFRLGLCYYYGDGVSEDIAKAVRLWHKASRQGYSVAQLRLGFCLETNYDKPNKAIIWYRRAAKQGSLQALIHLGLCYFYGIGILKNRSQAVKLWSKAAEHDDIHAWFMLGFCYEFGLGVTQDKEQAIVWYSRAAEKGHANSQYRLGVCYFQKGANAYMQTAVEWWRKAADNGSADAQFSLGMCYAYGIYFPEIKKSEAYEWLLLAAEQGHEDAESILEEYEEGGFYPPVDCIMKFKKRYPQFDVEQLNLMSKYNLGLCYYTGEGIAVDKKKAAELWQEAAEGGNINAQFMLGKCYENSEGGQGDMDIAVNWWLKAAQRGHPEAQYELGTCYYHGNGVPIDFEEAFKWWNKAAGNGLARAQQKLDVFIKMLGTIKAAKLGDAQAQYDLGSCYYYNEVSKDVKEAFKWWRRAAIQGNAEAQYELSSCYYYGNGVSIDFEEAFKWWNKAKKNGHIGGRVKPGSDYEGSYADILDMLKAAELGDEQAQYALGSCYYYNEVSKDVKEAFKWWRRVAKQGTSILSIDAKFKLASESVEI